MNILTLTQLYHWLCPGLTTAFSIVAMHKKYFKFSLRENLSTVSITISAETTQMKNAIKNQTGASVTWKTQPTIVSSMSSRQREVFEQNLKSAEEVALTLVYEDGWSLLRPKKQQVFYIVTIRALYCYTEHNKLLRSYLKNFST